MIQRSAAPLARLGFDRQAFLRWATKTLQEPPRAGVVRVTPIGTHVASFVLPLEYCPPLNKIAELAGWRRRQIKQKALAYMLGQNGFKRCAEPLPGRPMVIAIRFSSHEPDMDSAFAKIPIDRLTSKNDGLGFLRDDRPKDVDLRMWWEPAAPGKGACLIEVWTGAP